VGRSTGGEGRDNEGEGREIKGAPAAEEDEEEEAEAAAGDPYSIANWSMILEEADEGVEEPPKDDNEEDGAGAENRSRSCDASEAADEEAASVGALGRSAAEDVIELRPAISSSLEEEAVEEGKEEEEE
jgi:hypothetical protein